MSQRRGSGINSNYFVNSKIGTQGKRNEVFFNKGEDVVLPDTSTVNDIYHVRDGEKSVKINRETLRENLNTLKLHAETKLNHLDENQAEIFGSIRESLRILYKSTLVYNIIVGDIREIFKDVTEVIPGTVGAFFNGCFADNSFPGPLGCSPKCAASLPPTDGSPGYEACEQHVLLLTEGKFSALNQVEDTTAYIYIEEDESFRFSPEQVSQLRGAGITKCFIVYGAKDGSYQGTPKEYSIDELENQGSNPADSDNSIGTSSSEETSNAAMIVFWILIGILILVGLYFLYVWYKSRY